PDEQHILRGVLGFYHISAPEQDEPLTREQVEELLNEQAAAEFSRNNQLLDTFVQCLIRNTELYGTHEPGVFDGDVVIFSAVRDAGARSSFLRRSWRPHIVGHLAVYPTDCAHADMLTAESVSMYGDQLKQLLADFHSSNNAN